MIEAALLILGLLACGGAGAAVHFYRQMQNDRQGLSEAQTALTQAQEQARGYDENRQRLEAERDDARSRLEMTQTKQNEQAEKIGKLESESKLRLEEVRKLEQEAGEAQGKLEAAQVDAKAQQAELARLEEELKNERSNAAEKMEMLQGAQNKMEEQFKVLAQNILDEKSKKFSDDSQERLKPLQQSVADFREKLDAFQEANNKERTELQSYIKHLRDETGKVSDSAENLVRAFQDSGKAQGTWGEEMLLKLLESADLREGENYITQKAHTTEEGKRQIPDVIIKLPKDKNLIIDSKVSVAAYLDYVSAEDDEVRAQALQQHIKSIDAHAKQLSDKNYNASVPNSHDFVLMFISPESAYILALREDNALFERAYKKNVVITGATTLMPILRAVANLWRTEEQQKNANEIAKRGAALHDKIVGLVEDMDKLGKNLETARKTYSDAQNKLQHGVGNIASRVEKMRGMGLETKKRLPQSAVVTEDEEDETGEEEQSS